MPLPPLIKQIDQRLQGLPDRVLTILLIVAALVLVAIALRGQPVLKAIALAWVIAP